MVLDPSVARPQRWRVKRRDRAWDAEIQTGGAIAGFAGIGLGRGPESSGRAARYCGVTLLVKVLVHPFDAILVAPIAFMSSRGSTPNVFVK